MTDQQQLLMLNPMLAAAMKMVADIGLAGPGKDGQIAEIDAWRFTVKTMREMRHALALGGTVNVDHIVDGAPDADHTHGRAGVAGHLGVHEDPAKVGIIKAAFAAEKKSFEDHMIEAVKTHGEHAHFHEDHGIIDRRTLPRKVNLHTGKTGDDVQPPPSLNLNHEAFAKAKAAK